MMIMTILGGTGMCSTETGRQSITTPRCVCFCTVILYSTIFTNHYLQQLYDNLGSLYSQSLPPGSSLSQSPGPGSPMSVSPSSMMMPGGAGPSFNSSKYTQLLAVIEEIGKDIRPTYAGNKSSAERLKRGIVHARILVREALMEAERSARQ